MQFHYNEDYFQKDVDAICTELDPSTTEFTKENKELLAKSLLDFLRMRLTALGYESIPLKANRAELINNPAAGALYLRVFGEVENAEATKFTAIVFNERHKMRGLKDVEMPGETNDALSEGAEDQPEQEDFLTPAVHTWLAASRNLHPMGQNEMNRSFNCFMRSYPFQPGIVAKAEIIERTGEDFMLLYSATVKVRGEGPIKTRTFEADVIVRQQLKQLLCEDPEKISDDFFSDVVLAAKGHYQVEGLTRAQIMLGVYFYHYIFDRRLEFTDHITVAFVNVFLRELSLHGFTLTNSDMVNLIMIEQDNRNENVVNYLGSYLAVKPVKVENGKSVYCKANPVVQEALKKMRDLK